MLCKPGSQRYEISDQIRTGLTASEIKQAFRNNLCICSCALSSFGCTKGKESIMNNEIIDRRPAKQSDPRVQLAFERTFLAYERTRIAWVRTALAFISFGFAIAKVLQYLREKQGETAS